MPDGLYADVPPLLFQPISRADDVVVDAEVQLEVILHDCLGKYGMKV